MKKLLLVLIFALVLSYSAIAEVAVESVTLSSNRVDPGTQVTVTAVVRNADPELIQDVDVRVTLSGTTSEATGTLSNLVEGTPQTVSMNLNVPQDASPGSHTVSATATNRAVPADTESLSTTLVVNRVLKFDLLRDTTSTAAGIRMTSEEGSSVSLNLKLKNTGNSVLNNVVLSHDFGTVRDSDDNELKLTLTPSSIASLGVNGEATLSLVMDVESGFEVKYVKGNLIFTSNEGPLLPNVPVTLSVRPSVCSAGSSPREIELDITDPDDDDEFEAGDEFSLIVNVENKANDNERIEVEAILYNVDNDKSEDKQTKTIKVDEDNDEDFTFDFVVPEDAEDNDEFELFVKAFQRDNEDQVCAEDSISLDVEVPDHKLLVESFSLTPATAECGDTVTGSLLLRNLGSSDEEVTLDVVNEKLKLSQSSSLVEVKEDRKRNIQPVSFRFVVPENAEDGEYVIQAKANYGGLTTAEKTLTLVNCGEKASEEASEAQTEKSLSASDSVAASSVTGAASFEDKSFFDTFNTGDVPTSVWVLVDVLLGVLIILALVWVFRKH